MVSLTLSPAQFVFVNDLSRPCVSHLFVDNPYRPCFTTALSQLTLGFQRTLHLQHPWMRNFTRPEFAPVLFVSLFNVRVRSKRGDSQRIDVAMALCILFEPVSCQQRLIYASRTHHSSELCSSFPLLIYELHRKPRQKVLLKLEGQKIKRMTYILLDMPEIRTLLEPLYIPVQSLEPIIQHRVIVPYGSQIRLEMLRVHGVEADNSREGEDI